MTDRILSIPHTVDIPDDGLLIGNGDISCSLYQKPGMLVWRLGKGDVWDRRLDYHLDPKPAHIKEMIKGIRDEKWRCGPYGGPVEALAGTDNPERMREICQGCPPSHIMRAYPCPKPVGELTLHYPPDLPGFSLTQELDVARDRLRVECAWEGGVRLTASAWIARDRNVLFLDARLEGWGPQTAVNEAYLAPVYFTLLRWADPDVKDYGAAFIAKYRIIFDPYAGCGGDPLPPPTVEELDGGIPYIEQRFQAEPTYPEGIFCGMTATLNAYAPVRLPTVPSLAGLRWQPAADRTGEELHMALAVETGGSRPELQGRLSRTLAFDRPA